MEDQAPPRTLARVRAGHRRAPDGLAERCPPAPLPEAVPHHFDPEELPTCSVLAGALISTATAGFPLARQRLRVVAEPSSLRARLWADADLGSRSPILFIENALDLSPEDQPVDIDVHLADIEVEVRVSDPGPGIPEEIRQAIFRPVVCIPSVTSRPGLGLGLYLARRIMEAHKGRISVASLPGGGSTFVLSFPRFLEG